MNALTVYKTVLVFTLLGILTPLTGAPRPVILDSAYDHDRWQTRPVDQGFNFAAYTGSFDSEDDNNGDGETDLWGVPEWVAYEVKRAAEEHNLANRPSWMTDEDMYERGIAPDDDSYRVSGTRELKEVKTDYRFVRGHLCPKGTAERISEDAAYNTHILLNAVPQLQWQNNGIWKDLEQRCDSWADLYGRLWVVCGPVFFNKTPSLWLGQDKEFRVAVPDALFKIVIREDPEHAVELLTFLIPNILPKSKDDPFEYLTTIDRLEELTDLDFLTLLSEDQQEAIEAIPGTPDLWESF